MKKNIVICILVLYCITITVLYVIQQQNDGVKTENAGVITITSKRQQVFKNYFLQYGWDFNELIFSGTTSLHMLTDEDWTSANESSKDIGLEGASSYNMDSYAYTELSIPIDNTDYECFLTPMAQTKSEKSDTIVFSCIKADILKDSEDSKTFIFPVTATREEIIVKLTEYMKQNSD